MPIMGEVLVLKPEKLRDLGRAVPALGKKLALGMAAPEGFRLEGD